MALESDFNQEHAEPTSFVTYAMQRTLNLEFE